MSARRTPAHRTPEIRVNDQRLTPRQSAAWRAAVAAEGQAEPDARARAAARFSALEAELDTARAQAQVRAGLNDSLALARGRGEQVELVTTGGAPTRIRIRSRDGLETLERSGALTPRQVRAGLLYRDLYEAADPERDLRSQLTAPAFLCGDGGRGAAAPETWAERRFRLSRALAAVEVKVQAVDPSARALRALREVAGNARPVSQVVRGGGGQAAFRQALVLALEAAAGHFGLA